MALVYNSIQIPYAASVYQSISISLFPRIRKSFAIKFNILGRVVKPFQAVYSIRNTDPVANSVQIKFSGNVVKSISSLYSFEYKVYNSVNVSFGAAIDVYRSVSVNYAIPGYTRVTRSYRVLTRFQDQTFIQPSVAITLSKT